MNAIQSDSFSPLTKIHYQLKRWAPQSQDLQRIVHKLQAALERDPDYSPWEKYILEGQELLRSQEQNYERPPVSADRLYMGIGEGQVSFVHLCALLPVAGQWLWFNLLFLSTFVYVPYIICHVPYIICQHLFT